MEHTELLEKLNLYQNENLLFLMETRLKLSSRKAKHQFRELKKLLFLVYLVQEKKVSVSTFQIFHQMTELDEAWHLFILMTQDYYRFCNFVFGTYLHHQPEVPAPVSSSDDAAAPIRDQISLVIKYWGSETAQAWYIKPKSSFLSRIRVHLRLGLLAI
jgi:hypothetical protein